MKRLTALAAALLLALTGTAAVAGPISGYPDAVTPLNGAEALPAYQTENGVTTAVQVSVGDISAYAQSPPNGMVIGSPAGGSEGPGSLNAVTLYQNGVLVPTPGVTANWTASQTFTGGASFPSLAGGSAQCAGIAATTGALIDIGCAGITVQTPFVGGTTGTVAPAPSQVSTAIYGYDAFGDSNTGGSGVLSPTTQAYPALIRAEYGGAATDNGVYNNYGTVSYAAADVGVQMFTDLARPSTGGNPLVTLMVGSNDSFGTTLNSTYLTSYDQIFMAENAGAVMTGEDLFQGNNTSYITQAGTWTADSTFTPFPGIKSTTNGSTATFTGAFVPNGILYVFFGDFAASAGTFTVSIDGTPATDTISGLTTLTDQRATTSNTSPAEVPGLARFVTTAGTHNIVVTVTSATSASNKVTLFGIGFPPANRMRGLSAPKIFTAGMARYLNGSNDANNLIINNRNQTDVGILQADGLNVTYIDVRQYVNDTTDMDPATGSTVQGCSGGNVSPFHLNACGHIHVAGAFEDAMNFANPPYAYPHFRAPIDLSALGAPATMAVANGAAGSTNVPPSSTTLVPGTYVVDTTASYSFGIGATIDSAGNYATELFAPNACDRGIGFSGVGTTATGTNLSAGEFDYFDYCGNGWIGTPGTKLLSWDTSGNLTVGSGNGVTATPTHITMDNTYSSTCGLAPKLVFYTGLGIGVCSGFLNIDSPGGGVGIYNGATQIALWSAAGLYTGTFTTDSGHTDATVCEDTTSHAEYFGSGTAGICLGTSSERYKHGIEPLGVGLAQIMALRPISYFLNADHGDPLHELYGFTAEAMALVLPKLVGADAAGKPNTADYLGLVPVLVKALQQQQAEIAALRREVGSLRHTAALGSKHTRSAETHHRKR